MPKAAAVRPFLKGTLVSREAVRSSPVEERTGPAPGGDRDEGARPRTFPLAPRAGSTRPLSNERGPEPGAGLLFLDLT